MAKPPIATYSIVACDLEARQWGVATQSKFLAVGSVVPWAEPDAGAVATQSYANPRFGPDGLALLREGRSAQEVVDALVAADEGRAERQVGIVAAHGRAASYTGDGCHDWAGGRTGRCYAAQGNILVSEATVDALAETFETRNDVPLAERLLGLQQLLFGKTPRDRWIQIDEELRGEIRERLGVLGYERLQHWAGVENLEERVDGDDEIDPVVLERLRRAR